VILREEDLHFFAAADSSAVLVIRCSVAGQACSSPLSAVASPAILRAAAEPIVFSFQCSVFGHAVEVPVSKNCFLRVSGPSVRQVVEYFAMTRAIVPVVLPERVAENRSFLSRAQAEEVNFPVVSDGH
jgi:hypothetical protein